jgi:hypothetical protein
MEENDFEEIEKRIMARHQSGKSIIHDMAKMFREMEIDAVLYGTGTITMSPTGRHVPYHQMYGISPSIEIPDGWSNVSPWITEHVAGPEPEEKDWKRTTFASGPETPPSNAKRARLRAKRKSRK